MRGGCGGKDYPVGAEVSQEGWGEGDEDGRGGEVSVSGVPGVVGAVEDVGFC